MIAVFLAIAMLPQTNELESQLVNGRYLDAAKSLREDARNLVSPEAVRQYTVLLTEYYARQLAFRGFFMKNITPGERLRLVRADQTTITGPNFDIVEDDLEGLLLLAEKKFPDDPDIQFARAVYVFNGTCCFVKPRIRLTQAQLLNAFRESDTRGIRSGSSMWALALDEMARGKPDRKRLSELLQKARSLRPDDVAVYQAFVDDLLQKRDFEAAAAHVRPLYELAVTPEEKADALARSARTFQGLGKHDLVMDAVNGGLKLDPQHSFLFLLGLDTLRQTRDQEAYTALLTDWLNGDPEKPALFRVYMDYMSQKGTYPIDEAFINTYEKAKDKTPLAGVTRRINLVQFALWLGKRQDAVKWVRKARKEAKKLEPVPKPLADYLDDLEARAKALRR